MPRFRILSEDGRSIRVEDTVTGRSLKASRIEVVKIGLSPLHVSIDFADEEFGLDIAAGEMDAEPARSVRDDEIDERPGERRTLS